MRKHLFLFLSCIFACFWCKTKAADIVNLTPQPQKMVVGNGHLQLPKSFTIGGNNLPADMTAEAQRFVSEFNMATGYQATFQPSAGGALLTIEKTADNQMNKEGYVLDVTGNSIRLKASTADGLYYGFQTIKKLLPANVAAGVKGATSATYELPAIHIEDAPRFAYRGFMLDVARHFFSVDEVKRFIDIMSIYKMNRFHWHLTDDQGWRIEIKKYPKLTTIGATAPNSYVTDVRYGSYWTNRPYGPYFYTQDQIKDVVAYAKKRHIEIVPEIDMPGHFTAAMTSYPEFSCSPNGHHEVWVHGGISNDVLNVANPKSLEFAKNILKEVMALFPYSQINIGGDECPTTAWERNTMCQEEYKRLHLKNYRELQSHFIKQLADFIAQNGHKTSVWNEAITAHGADVNLIKDANATVYCWNPSASSALKAAKMGLDNIVTVYGPYYINRKQSNRPGEPSGAGDGRDNLPATYNYVPVPANLPADVEKHYTGVQGTFWTEHVADTTYLEYLALPRLFAIAEAGWTPQNGKNYSNFEKRMEADSALWNLLKFNYCKHDISAEDAPAAATMLPKTSNGQHKFYYQLMTKATDKNRKGRCIELLLNGSPLIAQYTSKGAAANVLWTNKAAQKTDANYDAQSWAFEESPTTKGHYALVNKALPNGSVMPNPTQTNNRGRWQYDSSHKYYDFQLGTGGSGKDGEVYYYTINSDKLNGQYFNASMPGQGLAMNLWRDPGAGNGGFWLFSPQFNASAEEQAERKISQIEKILPYVKVYSSQKELGKYSETALNELKTAIEDVKNMDNLSDEQQMEKTKVLDQKITAFYDSFGYLEKGKTYRFTNAVNGYDKTALIDDDKDANAAYLQNNTKKYSADAWEVTEENVQADHTQNVQIKNAATGRTITGHQASAVDKMGYPIMMGSNPKSLSIAYELNNADYILGINGKNLFPIANDATMLPGIVSSGSSQANRNAIRPQGAAWNIEEVYVVTYIAKDENGNVLFRKTESAKAGDDYTANAPEEPNYKLVKYTATGNMTAPVFKAISAKQTVEVIYKKAANNVRFIAMDEHGAYLRDSVQAVEVGKSCTVDYGAYKYYTYKSATIAQGADFTPAKDTTLVAVFTTKALSGVKMLKEAVSVLENGHSYVIYDLSPSDAARRGYCNVGEDDKGIDKSNISGMTSPLFTWTLEKKGIWYNVKNEYTSMYVPQLPKGPQAIASATPGNFTFTLLADKKSWQITGTNNLSWDGNKGNLTGWTGNGHPYAIYAYYAQPYFTVTVKCVDKDGKLLQQKVSLVPAGEAFNIVPPAIEGLVETKIEGSDETKKVEDFITVTITYEKKNPTGISPIESKKSQNSAIYDLNGRRLHAVKSTGCYIINGKKVWINK